MSWLLASHNTVFAAAFVVVLCLALLEGVSLLMGLGVSDFLSDLLGLGDGVDPTAQSAGAGGTESGISHPIMSWLEAGKVPLLVSLCAFFAAFSILGMTLQQALILAGMGTLIQPVAAGIAFFLALPVMKMTNRFLGKIWPQDETSSFAAALLIGRVGVVTIGTASRSRAAEIKVTGPDGRSHYVMAFVTGEPVAQGGEVLLLSRNEATGHYFGEGNSNPDLSPKVYS